MDICEASVSVTKPVQEQWGRARPCAVGRLRSGAAAPHKGQLCRGARPGRGGMNPADSVSNFMLQSGNFTYCMKQ